MRILNDSQASSRLLIVIASIALLGGLLIGGCRKEVSKTDKTSAQTPVPVEAPYGIASRAAWTKSKVLGSPDPADPFRTERIFPKLKFVKPLDIAFVPGSDRIFIVQQEGKILSFVNDPAASKADLFLDVNQCAGLNAKEIPHYFGLSVYGLAFHPQFQKNHYCYICYVIGFPYKQAVDYARTYPQNKYASRLSRFTVSDTNPPTIDPKSEKILFTWPGAGHNGGCLKFGPDGDLYLSTGDNGDPNPPDPFHIGQDVADVRSKILRLDVDHPAADKPYSIPHDNPFVSTPGARGEVFAYGLRNPWRMSFDRTTGELWLGDVGWELWESVHRITPAGNYGWSITEGPQAVYPTAKRGPTPITPPEAALPHTEAASITGGFVYRGSKLPDLVGQYIFGDWETRRLWAAPYDGKHLAKYRTIAQTELRIVAFGEDPQGELTIVDYEGGGLFRIIPNPKIGSEHEFPHALSETGLFADVTRQTPNPGVIPFDIVAPQWVDGSTSQRFIAIPSTKAVFDDDEDKRIYPANTVLARTLSLPMTAGDPSSTRKIETQLLHFNGRQWHGYAYQWNAEQTDATLVDGNGFDETLTITDPAAPNGKRQQLWHFNSRAQCMTCHTTWTNYTLAFNESQLDLPEKYPSDHGAIADNQVRAFRHVGLIPNVKPPKVLKDGRVRKPEPPVVLVNPYDESHSVEDRARSWLHVNCSVCHRKGGGGTALFDVRREMNLKDSKVISNAMLGTFNLPDAQVVCPGDPARSVLFYRMAKTGTGRMPHLGSTVIDDRGLDLVAQWISGLHGAKGAAQASDQTLHDESSQLTAIKSLQNGASGDAAKTALDQLLKTTEGGLRLVLALEEGQIPSTIRLVAVQHAMSSPQETIRDLFWRFSPEAATAAARLGTNPDISKLLALKGDAAKGKKVFFETAGGLCSKCHIIDDQGIDMGPNLSHIGTKYNKADLLDNILHPSKTILQGYETYAIRTKSGEAYVGFMASKSEKEVVLKDMERKLIHIKAEDIDKTMIQPISAMPEGIIADLTPEQAADLLEYLAERK